MIYQIQQTKENVLSCVDYNEKNTTFFALQTLCMRINWKILYFIENIIKMNTFTLFSKNQYKLNNTLR